MTVHHDTKVLEISNVSLVTEGNLQMTGLVPVNMHWVLFKFNIKPLALKEAFVKENVSSALPMRSRRASAEMECTSCLVSVLHSLSLRSLP